MQILLIMAMVFLGIQLFTQPNQKQNEDKRTAAQVFADIQKKNAELEDVTMFPELRVYEDKLRAEAKDKPDLEKQIDGKVLAAYTIYADTAMKSGLYRQQLFKSGKVEANYGYTKVTRAYDQLRPKYEALGHSDIWKEQVPVFPTEGRPQTVVTPESLYADVKTTLSPMAKAEPVFLIVPGYQLIDFLVNLTGAQPWFSYAFAAFLLALAVRLIIWPMSQKQFIWGRQMQQLQPYIKEIQEKYKKKDGKTTQEDQVKMQAEIMDLYKEYGLSPFAGCLPMFIQLPFFWMVYQCMHHYKFEFTKGFFLWIHPGATTFLNVPMAPNLGEKDYFLIAAYAITMVISTMLTPVSDPANYKQQKLMGLGAAVLISVSMFFYPLPSAFILYWTFTNILSTVQSLLVNRMQLPPLQKVATTAGGSIPTRLLSGDDDASPKNGSTNGHVSPGFFGKTGTPKANKQKKKKR